MPSPRSLPVALTLLTVLLPLALTSTIPSLFSMPHHTIFTRQVSNLQTFTGSLGGAAPPITQSGDSSRPFEVGGSTFTDFKSAAQRTCDNQFTACASQANAEQNKGGFTVTDCSNQKSTASPSILAISFPISHFLLHDERRRSGAKPPLPSTFFWSCPFGSSTGKRADGTGEQRSVRPRRRRRARSRSRKSPV